MNTGNIFLIPSPISNNTQNNVITPEVKKVIKFLNIFLVENLRASRRYISSLKLNIDISSLEFLILDINTDDRIISEYLEIVLSGENVGIISEAGCPGIADPGSDLISKAHRQVIKVVPLAGPSSIFIALMSSGFNGQSFTFHGYFPIEQREKKKSIIRIERELKLSGYTQIFMETPYRNEKLLNDLISTLNQNTMLCVACDLSGENEFIKTTTIREWKKLTIDLHKKPAIYLIGQS